MDFCTQRKPYDFYLGGMILLVSPFHVKATMVVGRKFGILYKTWIVTYTTIYIYFYTAMKTSTVVTTRDFKDVKSGYK